MDEERTKWQEIEERLEQERKLREEQEQMVAEERQRMMNAERQRYEAWQQQMQTMFAYIQGLGASVNYQPPPTVLWPPPAPPPPQMPFTPMVFLHAVTPVRTNVFVCNCLY